MKCVLVFIGLLLLLSLSPSRVRAHNVDADQKVTVLLHAEPYEDPVVGEKAYINFFVSDRDKLFSFENCDCDVSIYKDGEVYLTQKITTYQLEHTFKEEGIYQVELSGKPLTSDSFQKFEVQFNLWVYDTNNDEEEILNHRVTYFIVFILMVTGFIWLFVRSKHREWNS